MGAPDRELEPEKNGAVSPNQAQNSVADGNETRIRTIDVRTELKKNLAEEFTAALLAQTTLTDQQRGALIEVVNNDQVTATSILQIISSVEDQP
jgi:hypothetical protein